MKQYYFFFNEIVKIPEEKILHLWVDVLIINKTDKKKNSKNPILKQRIVFGK